MSGSQTSPVASATGRDVGALDTQVLEKLQETFFYRQFDFCYHSVPPSFGQSTTGTSSPMGMTPYYSLTSPGQTSCWVLLVYPSKEAYNTPNNLLSQEVSHGRTAVDLLRLSRQCATRPLGRTH